MLNESARSFVSIAYHDAMDLQEQKRKEWAHRHGVVPPDQSPVLLSQWSIGIWQQCQFAYFLQRICRIRENMTPKALSFGQAWDKAWEGYLSTSKVAVARKAWRDSWREKFDSTDIDSIFSRNCRTIKIKNLQGEKKLISFAQINKAGD